MAGTEFFEDLCRTGLVNRYGENPAPELTQRLEHEMSVIKKMGYVDYFLIVWDFINYARSKASQWDRADGSGAGSIAAYSMWVVHRHRPHQVQPGLFERFLNPERVSMPDFDIDFCYERRARKSSTMWWPSMGATMWLRSTFGTMGPRDRCGMWAGLWASVTSRWTHCQTDSRHAAEHDHWISAYRLPAPKELYETSPR